ncbi:MAG: HAMP domain-containing protein, partial [Gammaproteobacteria bacterium]|nr:HAMP domain-containing protein [Gammaproteobacteria bacterium]
MTIKFKLLLISGGIAVAMLLSIASMYWSVNTINSLTETQNINHQLLSNMLMLRRNEKDFLLRNDLKYLDKYNKNFIIMQENISQLSVLLNSNNITIDNYDSLSTILNTYRSRFHQLVDLSKQIGLNPKSGQRGSLRDSVHKAESILKEMNDYKLLKDMLMLRRNEKDFLLRKNAKYIDKFNNNFKILIADINDSDINDTDKDMLLKHINTYKKDFLQLSVLTEKKGFGPKLGVLGEMRHTIHQSEDLLKQMSSQIEETIQSTSDSIQTMNLIISLVIALVIVSFTLFSAQTIIRSLAGFLETLKEVSHTGNLALRVDVQGNDEISEVGVTLNKMLSEFQGIVQRLQIASADLSEYSQQFMSIRTNTFSNVEKQQLETEQVSIAMTELSTSARNIAQNTTLTAEASKQANTISNEGKNIVDSSIHSTQSLESVINNASHVIQKLGEDSNSIGGILEVIRGIAEQTNLLALNAAIEAARAGEQGRGFAVVADEVRTLAQKTQDSISEIEAMISSLQNGSNMAIEAITQGKDGVTSNVKQISKAGDSLVTIVTELNSINQMSQENVVATEAQSAVAEDVNKSVLAIKELGSLMVENIEQLKQSG